MDSDTDAAPDPDTDDRDIRARVAELEATVAQQQETISQLLPSRRRVLQAGGLVAGGGALGALSADRASADVVGQVGTDADRVDVFAGQVDANSVSTGSLVIGGTLFKEDANSPINVSSVSSTSYKVSGDFDEVIVLPDPTTSGFDQLRVNGDSGSNYRYVDNGNTETQGATEWSIPSFSSIKELWVRLDSGNNLTMGTHISDTLGGATTAAVGGRNTRQDSINSLDFLNSSGTDADAKARVYGRSFDI